MSKWSGIATLLSCSCFSVWGISTAQAFTIQISNNLSGGDFYQTQTLDQAIYERYTGGTISVAVPPAADFMRTPTLLSSGLHPVKGRSGGTGNLFTDSRPKLLSVGEGVDPSLGAVLGRGTHSFNIGGTFKVVPDPGDPTTGDVDLLAKGMLDGLIRVATKALADPPSASFNASIFIEKLGTATGTATSTGSTTETVGIEPNLSKEPGVSGKAERSVQVSTGGTAPVNFFMLGKVPIDTTLNWNFTMTLQAMNTENFLDGRSAADSFLAQQFVNLTAQYSDPKKDPFFSDSLFGFDANTGELSVLHPNATIGMVEGSAILEDDGTPGPTPVVDFSGFLPEVEAILAGDEFSETDSLLHSLLNYSGIFLDQSNPDGTFSFTDGLLEFLNPSDLTDVLARARLTDILADPSADMFSAHLTDFEFVNLSPDSSPLGLAFLKGGGEIWFDPSIIQESQNFTVSATTSEPYLTDGRALEVPEPTSSISLFALGTLGAALTLKRKPQK